MKNNLYNFYQLFSNFRHTILYAVFGYSFSCHHSPSCSKQLVLSIKKNGTIMGFCKGFVRVLGCF